MDEHDAPPTCAICLSEYRIGEVIGHSHNSKCKHAFHKPCILDWLDDHDDCPCCRNNYIALDDEESEQADVEVTNDVDIEVGVRSTDQQESSRDSHRISGSAEPAIQSTDEPEDMLGVITREFVLSDEVQRDTQQQSSETNQVGNDSFREEFLNPVRDRLHESPESDFTHAIDIGTSTSQNET